MSILAYFEDRSDSEIVAGVRSALEEILAPMEE
jgi:hypothetical protein